MTGQEVFSMDGEQRFMKAVDFGENQLPPKKEDTRQPDRGKSSLRRIK
jgi:hypothetical protein